MVTHSETMIAIVVMAVVLYLMRIGGYLLGQQIRHIGALRPVLEALPGCAFMAILFPAAHYGSLTEIIALLSVIGLMWKTNNVALATIVGLLILFLGGR